MKNLTNLQKEKIESHLLKAMKELEAANEIIFKTDECIGESGQIIFLKKEIKKILNKEFDHCARNKPKLFG